MIKLVWDPDNGRVLGGSIVGYRASEVITTVALAVKAQLTVDTLAETGAVNPSVSESLQRCAERRQRGARKTQHALVREIHRSYRLVCGQHCGE